MARDVGGDAVEIGQEIVLGRERQLVDDAAVVAGVRAGDRVAGHGHQRDVARVDEAGRQHGQRRLRADAVVDLGRRIERDAELALHEPGDRLLEARRMPLSA